MKPAVLASSRAAQIAALVMAQPRTARDLARALGIPLNHPERVMRFVDEAHDLGCVYIKEWAARSNRMVPVFAWQPSLFSMPDAARPDRYARTK